MGAGCGWRGVNPIHDLVAPPDFMLIRWQTCRSKGGFISRQDHPHPRDPEREHPRRWSVTQKFIAVIGSVVAERLDVEARRDFWKAAHERLATYVHDDDRSKIEAELAGDTADDGSGGSRVARCCLTRASNRNSRRRARCGPWSRGLSPSGLMHEESGDHVGRYKMEYTTPASKTALRTIEAMPAVSRMESCQSCFGSNAMRHR